MQENTFLSKTHQKLSFYQKYIKKLSFYLKYIKSSKSIINKCQDLLGITKEGRGPLKALEGLCAMMAPSEWGSGYEPLLRMGGGIRAHICHKYHKLYLWKKIVMWRNFGKFWEILRNFGKFCHNLRAFMWKN